MKTKDSINISISGDYHIYGKFDKYIKECPYQKIFDDDIVNILSECDLNIFNLEDPISEKKEGILKYGPYGFGSRESIVPISKAGFNIATFATNHTFDMGEEGIKTTFEVCKGYGIDIVGAGKTKEDARKIYYRQIKNYKVAILNFARREFNIATDKHGGANPLDVIDNVQDILEAKKQTDFVFVIVHEGVDVFNLPYPLLVKQMRFYADMGASAIILHHSRIISGYEVYNNVPIFYGIGNLLHFSDNKEEHKGIILKFQISDTKLDHYFYPIELKASEMKIALMTGDIKEKTLKKISELSNIIQDEVSLNKEWNKYADSNKGQYVSLISGNNRIFYKFCRRIGLSGLYFRIHLLRKKKLLSIWNIIRCQSHKEIMNSVLENAFNSYKR
jgi:poly-gamma-glutamate synthesis protein (capsule biosynthesis protein)